MMSAQEVIDEDGLYSDGESQFQYRKGTVVPPGRKAILKRVGDFPAAEVPGAAEMAATETTPEEVAKTEADAKAKADADAKAAADAQAATEAQKAADAKAAPAADNKKAPAPENKSA